MKPKTTLKLACAYCGKPMGEIDGQGVTGTSHRTCPECLIKARREVDEFLAEQRKEKANGY